MLGVLIKKFLDENGIKYSFVANGANIPVNSFSSMINGKRKMTAEEYVRICQVLQVDFDYFVKISTALQPA